MAQYQFRIQDIEFRMKHLLTFFLLSMFVLFLPVSIVSAQSEYVLPYPSAMPGSVWYKMDLIFEQIQKYWHFGAISQFKYNLKQADKYLVEAKTLFEYKQYLLAYEALVKSDKHFKYASENIITAAKEKKDISSIKTVLRNASLKHISVLEELTEITPVTFTWRPEKGSATKIMIYKSLDKSIGIRKNL